MTVSRIRKGKYTQFDVVEMPIPDDPASGTRRIFVDDATHEVSVRKSDGTTVSLEADRATDIGIDVLGTPTYTTIQDFVKTILSAGRTTGGLITAHAPADGTVDISAGTGFIKTTDSAVGDTKSFDWNAQDSLVLVDHDTNYIYVDYDTVTETVTIQATTDRTTIDGRTEFTLGRVYRDGNNVHIAVSGMSIADHMHDNHERLILVRAFERASGGVIAEIGVRNLQASEGVFFMGANKIETTAQDTTAGGGDTFTVWYRDGAGGWSRDTGETQIDNANYDADDVLGPQPLTANRYGVFWVFIHYDSDIQLVYGQGDYTLANAEIAALPVTLPDQVTEFSALAAKIIIQEGAASATSIVGAYTTLFPVSAPTLHNDLGGLLGGVAGEYYHMTLAEYTELTEWLDDVTLVDGGAITGLTDITMTGSIIVGGTVDGVDVAGLKTDVDGFPDELKNLAAVEIQQLENIGAVTISNAQWGYLGALDQGLTQASSPTFAGVTINGNIVVTGTVDGIDIAALQTDVDGFQDELKDLTQVEIQQLENIDAVTISNAQWAYVGALDQGLTQASTPTFAGLTINGNIAVTGTVDGVDIAALKTDVDGFQDELKDLTQVEIQQLENIDAVTISNAQWGYLGALDQGLTQASSPTFAGVTINGNIVVTGTVDGIDIAALQTDVDGFNDELKDLTQVEIQQLENIDAVTISNAQWGYLGALDQGLTQASSPTFVGLTLSGALSGVTTISAGGTYFQVDASGNMLVSVADATAILPMQDSATLELKGKYWTGAVTADAAMLIGVDVTVTTPEYEFFIKREDLTKVFSVDEAGNGMVLGDFTVANLVTAGNVDGVDISALKTDVDGFNDELKDLTQVEIQQLENIDAVTISNAQWGYLGALDQGLTQASSPTFAGVTINGNIVVTGTVDGIDIAALQTDVDGFNDELKDLAQVEIQQLENIGAVTITNAQWGYLGALDQGLTQASTPTFAGLTINGNIAVTGTVDGVDIAALQTDVDGFHDELKDLTQVEIQQLENIGAVTISNAQWGYLGALDQGLIQASSPTFVGLTLSGAVTGITTFDAGTGTFGIDAAGYVTTYPDMAVGADDYVLTYDHALGTIKLEAAAAGANLATVLGLGNETDGTNILIDSAGALIFYSDDKITEKARIDGATGNITTAGTVDGVDVAGLKTDVDGFNDELKDLAQVEIQQLENIGAVTITNAQWGYLGALDQGLTIGSSPTFAGATINGNIIVTGNVDGVDVSTFKTAYDSHVAASDFHIPHSDISIIAGTGLSGGGTIAASRTINCDITQYHDWLAVQAVQAADPLTLTNDLVVSGGELTVGSTTLAETAIVYIRAADGESLEVRFQGATEDATHLSWYLARKTNNQDFSIASFNATDWHYWIDFLPSLAPDTMRFQPGGTLALTLAGANATVAGDLTAANIVTAGLVDGVDVAALKTDVDGFNDELKDLAQVEIQQLENIGAVTISNAQWGYLGALDQGLTQASSPTFAGLTVVNAITEFSTDGTLVGNSDSALPTEKAVKTYVDGQVGGNVFKTITGITNDVVADAVDDTLTLATGNNILSIVGTPATDTITFTINQANISHDSIGAGTLAHHSDVTATGAQVEALLMFGAANSAWEPCIVNYVSVADGSTYIGYGTGAVNIFGNIDGTDTAIMLTLPLPTNKNGLKLWIKGARAEIFDADAYNYLDRIRVYATRDDGFLNLLDDGNNKVVPDTHNYPFTAVDCSAYTQVVVYIEIFLTDAGAFDLRGIMLDCYYAP